MGVRPPARDHSLLTIQALPPLPLLYHHDREPDIIVPGERERAWMGRHDRWPYRCLPLLIANQQGWEIRCPEEVAVEWGGRPEPASVRVLSAGPWVRGVGGVLPGAAGHFGHGVLTFNLRGMFRTPPGWNLLVSGAPNHFKDAIAPLTAVVETDWLSYQWTMNWRFTRPCRVVFARGEPFAFVVPVPRGLPAMFEPLMAPMPEVDRRRMTELGLERDRCGGKPGGRYTRGELPGGQKIPEAVGHETKLEVRPFRDLRRLGE